MTNPVRSIEQATLYCSFCGKSQHEVRKLIAGPKGLCICGDCVDLSAAIVATMYGSTRRHIVGEKLADLRRWALETAMRRLPEVDMDVIAAEAARLEAIVLGPEPAPAPQPEAA